MRTAAISLGVTAVLLLCGAAPRAVGVPAPEWWEVGQPGQNRDFIDADSIDWMDTDYVTFHALSYWTQLQQYETEDIGIDCKDRERLSISVYQYDLKGTLLAHHQSGEHVKVDPAGGGDILARLLATQYAFACQKERAGGPHGFKRIPTDPLTFIRR